MYNTVKDIESIAHPKPNSDWINETLMVVKGVVRKKYGILGISSGDLASLMPLIKDSKLSDKYDGVAAIGDILNGNVSKPFEANKVYKRVKDSVSIDMAIDPVNIVNILIRGIVGKDEESVSKAEQLFDNPEKFTVAKNYFRRAFDQESNKPLYKMLWEDDKEQLQNLSAGDRGAAKSILRYLHIKASQSNSIGAESLSDIVVSTFSKFKYTQPYTNFAYKTQSVTVDDLYDDEICCTFYPEGKNKEAAALYVLDSNIALLQLCPVKHDGDYAHSIGAAISFFASDSSGKKYLVVDSVEGGDYLPTNWKEDFYEVIEQFARSNSCSNILYNSNTPNDVPREFNRFLKNQKHMATDSVQLMKIGGTDTIDKYFSADEYDSAEHYLEAFGEPFREVFGNEIGLENPRVWGKPEGLVTGYIVSLDIKEEMIVDN